ncbi:hypothetical protein C4D60_Mb06t32860 [Musa balbisiana]|uniref:RING-type domain-containing protein n=1 Tax=Musa balbisiana TaxID=52838 RepID=A0A4S8IUW0_MUSBA|nr:hypothetical protein C4D60_Mb06t32860 [Musa balbisiana]
MSILLSNLLFFLVRIIQLHARAQLWWGSHHDVHPPATRNERPRNGPHEAAECVFCLCDIEEGEEIRELRCRHLFHRSCLDRWLVRRRRATCPLCRDVLLPREPATVKSSGGGAGDDDEDELDDWTVMLFAYLRWWMT